MNKWKDKDPSGVASEDVIWLQISAGQGPRECAWLVAQVLKRLMQEAKQRSVSVDLLECLAFDRSLRKQDLMEIDAYRSCLLRLEGKGAGDFAQSWSGSIQWRGSSPYRPKHKRSNWFVGVERMSIPEMKSLDSNKLLAEVDIDSMRSGGPGGQHVNKTNSAVRVTHRPSGLQVRVESDRSQHRNRQLAIERLQILLAARQDAASKTQSRERWLSHYQVDRGNPVRIFCGNEFIEQNRH